MLNDCFIIQCLTFFTTKCESIDMFDFVMQMTLNVLFIALNLLNLPNLTPYKKSDPVLPNFALQN